MGAAECEYSEVVPLAVEHRVSLSNDDGFKDGQSSMVSFMF